MNHIACADLGSLARFGIIHYVDFTYVLWSAQLKIYHTSAYTTYHRWYTQQLDHGELRGRACQAQARQKPRVSSVSYRLGGHHWACEPSNVRGEGATALRSQSQKSRRAIVKIIYVSALHAMMELRLYSVRHVDDRRWSLNLKFDILRGGKYSVWAWFLTLLSSPSDACLFRMIVPNHEVDYSTYKQVCWHLWMLISAPQTCRIHKSF